MLNMVFFSLYEITLLVTVDYFFLRIYSTIRLLVIDMALSLVEYLQYVHWWGCGCIRVYLLLYISFKYINRFNVFWFKSTSMSGGGHDPSLEDKVRRLETDKESLMLQVSVLTDQVEAQGDKISDLLKSMEDSNSKLKTTEKMLRSVSTSLNDVSTCLVVMLLVPSSGDIPLRSTCLPACLPCSGFWYLAIHFVIKCSFVLFLILGQFSIKSNVRMTLKHTCYPMSFSQYHWVYKLPLLIQGRDRNFIFSRYYYCLYCRCTLPLEKGQDPFLKVL